MLRSMSFPKTVLVFRRYSFKILRYLLVSTSLKNFCWQVNIYIYSYLLWNIRVWNIRVCFDNLRWKIWFLKSLKDLKLEDFKIFLFYLISKVSWFISDFIICWNENGLTLFWLLIAIKLGWFLYCSIILRIGCAIRFSVWWLSIKGSR